ncbi:MAG: quinone-dependent dihydroorotate dehydrogenase [Rhizobiales bacterium]|nr:quinone-dependent dihydroorotate dehydrogenase [Hyphomicrobiales bacterium]
MSLAGLAFSLARPVLHSLDAERAHRLTIAALRMGLVPAPASRPRPELAQNLFGLVFPNPLGLAAGFDKNAEVAGQTLRLGFGFVEVGTVTPRPQGGNPRPRLFRLGEDHAVINRMGFNNEGHTHMRRRLAGPHPGIIGVNIGANKDSEDRIADYVAGYDCFAGVAEYVTVNISSPNTPGLRNLQGRGELGSLLARLGEAQKAKRPRPPILLKIAPDLSEGELEQVAEACLADPVAGVIISNTTTHRPALRSKHAGETGGLSGRPLFGQATRQLARFYLLTGGRLPLIGVGGIEDAETAWIKLRAGASLLQIYSALVFKGPALIEEILSGLSVKLKETGYGAVEEAVGCDAEALAAQGSSGT